MMVVSYHLSACSNRWYCSLVMCGIKGSVKCCFFLLQMTLVPLEEQFESLSCMVTALRYGNFASSKRYWYGTIYMILNIKSWSSCRQCHMCCVPVSWVVGAPRPRIAGGGGEAGLSGPSVVFYSLTPGICAVLLVKIVSTTV